MDKIKLETLRIPKNLVLIKPDPDFEFIVIKPESKLSAINEPQKIWIGYDQETMARHYGVTGKVLKLPEQLVYNGPNIKKFRQKIGTGRTRSDSIRCSEMNEATLEIDVQNELEVDDKIWFDYMSQISVFEENLIVDVEGHGLCFFVKYDRIYCYQRNGEIAPINGWVWIERPLKETDLTNGLKLVPSEANKHEPKIAIVLKAAKPIKEYLDTWIKEDLVDLNPGDKILFNDKFGHEIEYGMHRTISKNEVLCIRRKNIYAVLESKKSKVKSKKTTSFPAVNDGMIYGVGEPYPSNKILYTL